MSSSRDSTRESSANRRESESQLTSWILSFINERNIESEKGIDVVVSGASDEACILSSVAYVGRSLIDGDNQIGE